MKDRGEIFSPAHEVATMLPPSTDVWWTFHSVAVFQLTLGRVDDIKNSDDNEYGIVLSGI